MRAVLNIFVLVTATVACPTKPHVDQCTSAASGYSSYSSTTVEKSLTATSVSTSDLPAFCPTNWQVVSIDTICQNKGLPGNWYLQMATPTCVKNHSPLRSGVFSNMFPTAAITWTIEKSTDTINGDFIVSDTAYNLYNGQWETTKMVFRRLYDDCTYAIFSVETQSCYTETIVDTVTLNIDSSFTNYTLDEGYARIFYVAIIGYVENEYLILSLINKYDNRFLSSDESLVWVFTQNQVPSSVIYNKIHEDLLKNCIKPRHLIAIDQSRDISTISSTSTDTTVQSSSVTSRSTQSSTSVSSDGYVSNTSSDSSITTSTTSSIDIAINSEYTSEFEIIDCELLPSTKVIKYMKNTDIDTCLQGRYYVSSLTPCAYTNDDSDDNKVGLFNNVFPCVSLQVCFGKIDNSPYSYKSPIMMVERGYNLLKDSVDETLSVILSAYDDTRHEPIFIVYTQGNYKKPLIEDNTLDLEGIICQNPVPDFYSQQVVFTIAAYKPESFLILCILNKFSNDFLESNTINQYIVLTREKQVCSTTMLEINQELLRFGCDIKYFITMDHSIPLETDYSFNVETFKLSSYSYSSTKSSSTTTESHSRSLTTSTSSSSKLPSFCPQTWQVVPMDIVFKDKGLPGTWCLQMATPTCVKNHSPLRSGVFSNMFPTAAITWTIEKSTDTINGDFIVSDTAYNLYNGQWETTKMVFRRLYDDCTYAIFSVETQSCYTETIVDAVTLNIDSSFTNYTLDEGYARIFYVAIIGYVENEYLILSLINRYDNRFLSSDESLVWVFTQNQVPSSVIYNKIQDDLLKNCIKPWHLVAIDQSRDISTISSTSTDTTVQSSSVTSRSTQSSTSVSSDGYVSNTSSHSSTTTSTTSSIDIAINSDYTSEFEIIDCELLPSTKVIKYMKNTDIDTCLQGRYYVSSLTPCAYTNDDSGDNKVGLFNNAFPCNSLQVCFGKIDNSPYTYKSPIMMVERGYNLLKDSIDETLSVILSAYDDTRHEPIFIAYTQGNYKKPLIEDNTLDLEGIICQNPVPDFYSQQVVFTIAAYKPESFLILCILNKFNNVFFESNTINQYIVLTREKQVCATTMLEINQELLRCGCDPKYFITMDHSTQLETEYSFDVETFKLSSYSSTYDEKTEQSVDESNYSVIKSSSSSIKSASFSKTTEDVNV